MSSHAISESEFLGWVSSGDHHRAAEWLVQRYADEVMGLCVSMVRNRSAAEDMVQEVFSRAFVGLKGFRAEASARTWLLTIARNRCFDHLRSRRREPWGTDSPVDAQEPDSLPDEVPLPAELLSRQADVEAALDELAEADRALIVLRFRNGLDYAELAAAFGLKPGTVRMRVSRSLARMRRALEERERAQEEELVTQEIAAPPMAESFEDDELDDELDGVLAEDFEEAIAPEEDYEELEAEPDWNAVTPPAPRQAPEPPPPPPPPPAKRRAAPAPAAPPAPLRVSAPRRPPTPPAEQQAAPHHPLAIFLSATEQPLSPELRARLISNARSM